MSVSKPSGPRSVALIGPYMSGKTTLLESILWVTGATSRKGSVTDGNTVGDSAQEARDRQMSTEVNVATTTFLDDRFTFLDCPGSVELLQETLNALPGVDAAVLVCEPDRDKFMGLMPLMKALEDAGIPRMVFVNKIDKATGHVAALLDSLQPVSSHPLVLRQLPIREGESITGYIDLASERTFVYKPNQPSEIVETPDSMSESVGEARYQMLETLADFNDELMEKVLEDVEPEKDEVYQNLTSDYQNGLIVPVIFGAAEMDHGVRRLLKALRHEVPAAAKAAERVGVSGDEPKAQVLKTYHTQHGGKLSIARVWSGSIKDGMTLNDERVSGLFLMSGHNTEKIAEAGPGDVVGLGRLESIVTGDTLGTAKEVEGLPKAEILQPVFAQAISTDKREDEVKLSGALQKVGEEDPSIIYGHEEDTHEFVLRGQGDIHLKIACDRLLNKYGLSVSTRQPKVPYKEAIRKPIKQHGRFKRQSGGHGQFGDVHLEIKPLPRGTGFQFDEKIVGGSVPKQFIPGVEAGVKEYLSQGPLGFPVVDVSVTLFDGQYHTVDSSEIAFRTAARIAMQEGMPQCGPVLLEPIMAVEIAVPSDYTPKANTIVSSRRGQILGFDARPGWSGWDVVSAHMPQSELHDLIVELRSVTQGVGGYTATFDHLQELTGRLADQVISEHQADAAA